MQAVGRIAFVTDGLPVVFPVNYRVVLKGGVPWIILRVRPAHSIDHAPPFIAFEIDGIDPQHHEGWSVLLRGARQHLEDHEVEDFAGQAEPEPWPDRDRPSWLAIKTRVVAAADCTRTTAIGNSPPMATFDLPGAGHRRLTRAACLDLLHEGGRARVAATMRAVPIIVPVTFVLEGGEVVFNTGTAEDLARAVADAVVAFETDDLGTVDGPLWAVHITGIARRIRGPEDVATFRLESEIVSGWQIDA